MLPFKSLIEIEGDKGPVYRQIADSVIRHIREGTLQPGAPLPGSRSMAALLGVHRNTVTAAYDDLMSQSWIVSIPRKGVRVAAELPLLQAVRFHAVATSPSINNEAVFSFRHYAFNPSFRFPNSITRNGIVVNDGFPDIELAPVDLIIREYRRLLDNRQLKKSMYLRDQGGTTGIKLATRDFINDSRGLNIEEKNVLITRGAQMAIYVAASMILRPGDVVVVSEPNYFIANQLFETLGAKLVKIPTDENGMMVDRISEYVSPADIRLIYVVPHHHHPTTVTLSPGRRASLLLLINEFNIPLIEDDYDYDFHYSHNPVLPLASGIHHGNVIYIGSYTKLLAPTFRIGYMVAAENFIREAITRKRLLDLRGDVIMEEAVAKLIGAGEIGRHIKKSLKVYTHRRMMMHELLNKRLGGCIECSIPSGGLAFWVRFDPGIRLGRIIEKAAADSVYLNGSSYYLGDDQHYNAIRLGFASLAEKDMERAFSVLAKAIGK